MEWVLYTVRARSCFFRARAFRAGAYVFDISAQYLLVKVTVSVLFISLGVNE